MTIVSAADDGNGIDKYWNRMNIQFDDTDNTKNHNDIYKSNNYFNNCYYDNHHVFNDNNNNNNNNDDDNSHTHY